MSSAINDLLDAIHEWRYGPGCVSDKDMQLVYALKKYEVAGSPRCVADSSDRVVEGETAKSIGSSMSSFSAITDYPMPPGVPVFIVVKETS